MALHEVLGRLFGGARIDAPQADQSRLAAAVLLVEIARADFSLAAEELQVIEQALAQQFGLSVADAQVLIKEAQAEHDAAICLAPYVAELNRRTSVAEKRALLEALWRVALADGVLDSHEEHMMRRVAELLFLSHADFIQSKLKVTGA